MAARTDTVIKETAQTQSDEMCSKLQSRKDDHVGFVTGNADELN